jgi:hypothetical protein
LEKNRLGGVAAFSYWQCYEGRAIGSPDGPIAQLDRVTDFYSVGCRFESCWDRQRLGLIYKGFLLVLASFYRPFRVAIASMKIQRFQVFPNSTNRSTQHGRNTDGSISVLGSEPLNG